MTFRARRFLFYGLFLLFILAGGGIVFYSQGWRINTENCAIKSVKNFRDCLKFQKIGAIYIETEPKEVVIEIDGKTFPDRSNIIQKGTLVSNLLPKTYKVKITKEGYLPYYKNLKVESSLVSELLNVILVPEELNEKTAVIPKIKGDALIDISNDNKKFIIRDSVTGLYRLYDLNNLSSILNLNTVFNNLKKETINKIIFHPFDSNKFIVETKSGLYILDTNRLKLETLIKPLPLSWTIKNPNVYYVNGYSLASLNLVVKAESVLSQLPNGKKWTGLEVSNSQTKIALINNLNDLYIFNQSDKNLEKIASNAEDFIFSPDDKKIAFLDANGSINVYFIEDYREGINKKAGDVVRLNLKNQSTIKKVFWQKDSNHLFVEYPGKTIFAEIDDRPPLNVYAVADNAASPFYNINDNLLYSILQNSLFSFQLEK